MASRWPTEVPVLGKNDVCKGEYVGCGGRRCLVGWLHLIFPRDKAIKVRHAFRLVIGNRIPESWNDDECTSYADIARAWNRSMAKLGYTEGNPEA